LKRKRLKPNSVLDTSSGGPRRIKQWDKLGKGAGIVELPRTD